MQRKGFQIRIWQWGLLAAIFVFWWAMTKPGFIPAFFFSDDSQAAFFFGEPVIILQRIWEWFAGGLNAPLREPAVNRHGRAIAQEAFGVELRIAEEGGLRHGLHELLGRNRSDGFKRTNNRIRHALNRFRIAVNEGLRRVEAARDHRAVIECVAFFHAAGVDHNVNGIGFFELRDDWVKPDESIHLPRADSCHSARARTNADGRIVIRLHARTRHHEVGHHVRMRPRRRHADAAAFERGGILDSLHGAAVNGKNTLRRTILKHKGLHGLALGLHRKRVLKRSRNHIR